MLVPEGWQGRQLERPKILGSNSKLGKQREEGLGEIGVEMHQRHTERGRRGLVPVRSAVVKNEDMCYSGGSRREMEETLHCNP